MLGSGEDADSVIQDFSCECEDSPLYDYVMDNYEELFNFYGDKKILLIERICTGFMLSEDEKAQMKYVKNIPTREVFDIVGKVGVLAGIAVTELTRKRELKKLSDLKKVK